MAAKGIIFDRDCLQLVRLLVEKHAKSNANYRRYDGNIGEQLQFEISNRALAAMGYTPVAMDPIPEPKK